MARGADRPSTAPSPETPTILLIEDNPAYIRLVRELLKEAGLDELEVEWADLLEDGLKRLDQRSIDLILLDLLLPDNMGTDTLEVLLEHAPETPVVVLTGVDDDELARDALDRGASDYLCKGRLDAERLARAVQDSLDREPPGPLSPARAGRVNLERLLPSAADRIGRAAEELDQVTDQLDPLASTGTEQEISREKARCEAMARTLETIHDLVETPPPRERISLHDVIDQALVRISADGLAGGRVTLDWAESPTVLGNREHLVRFFETLLTHVLTSDQGKPTHLRLEARREEDAWIVEIGGDLPSDPPEDALAGLFSADLGPGKVSGRLAHTLCEAIVTSHGGRFWADPGPEGDASISLQLPAGGVLTDVDRPGSDGSTTRKPSKASSLKSDR